RRAQGPHGEPGRPGGHARLMLAPHHCRLSCSSRRNLRRGSKPCPGIRGGNRTGVGRGGPCRTGGQRPFFSSIRTCLAAAFSVSKTPMPLNATASKTGSFLYRRTWTISSVGIAVGRSRLLSWSTYGTFINYAAREINCKIVYYGPGLCGKTTNIQYIYDKTNPGAKGKLISLATETDRTLFFDFLPLDLGTIKGFKTRFHLYTVPGQVFYDASRKLILKGVDGVVFVADSQEARLEANVESIRNLDKNLKEQGYEILAIPYVLQFNKRDLPTAVPPEEMYRQLNFKGEPTYDAIATNGTGVFDTLKAVAKLVLTELKKK